MAKFIFRYGAMNCGKSSALLQVAHNYDERDNNVILIKPQIDLKGGKKIVSRIGISRDVDYLIGKCDCYRHPLHRLLLIPREDILELMIICSWKQKELSCLMRWMVFVLKS